MYSDIITHVNHMTFIGIWSVQFCNVCWNNQNPWW